MSKNLHTALRFLQWFIPALATFFCVLDKTFGWGLSTTVMAVVSGLVAFLGVCVEHDSSTYFSTRDIVDKVVPDEEGA